ncbi:MAG: hypothetical protein RIB98_02755 [Acidimicrobiales bacterium]
MTVPNNPLQKKTLATAAVATTLGGALAGATLFAPGLAGAQDDTEPSTDETTTEETTSAAADHEPGDRIADVLQGLVDDGTLTQSQLDAVVETLVAAAPERGERGHGRRGFFAGDAGIAEILDLEQAELREALVSGQTLADVAAAQGVDTQDLLDALVDAAEARVATGLEDGRIEQERADEILADAEEKATDLVNGELEFQGRRGHRGGPADGTLDQSDPDA